MKMETFWETVGIGEPGKYLTHDQIHKYNLRYEEDGFTPPPFPVRKDKMWSRMLRKVWPEFTKVVVRPSLDREDGPTSYEMSKWCRSMPGGYWVNNGSYVWYFERREIAVMFKLTFGGAQ